MRRRSFLKSLAAAGAAGIVRPQISEAALPKAKITRVRVYLPPNLNQTINQSNMLCTVETDIGITGIGEGGTKDLLEQCAGSLIGKNPFQIEKIWQYMYADWFYPPGREKIHAQGALDLALWDIKGKALKLPIHEMLGGVTRNYCDCYPTGGIGPAAGGGRGGGRGGAQGGRGAGGDPFAAIRDSARAVMEAGFRCYRMDAGAGTPLVNNVFNTHQRVHDVAKACKAAREGVGPNGDWFIDLHQKLDYADSLRACKLMEEYEPYAVEDPVRDEHAHMYIPKLRQMTSVPLCHGEEWGQRYDFYRLVENGDIDYIRATLPNVGGITEMRKVMALCETHAVGIIPHFTGPVSTAALCGVLSTYSGPVMVEGAQRPAPSYLPECHDFKAGKLYPNDRPGLGVTLDIAGVKQIAEITQAGPSRVYLRPDGSLTHW